MRSLLLVSALALTAACGDDGNDPPPVDAPISGDPDAPPAPRETVSRTVMIGAGQFREPEVRLNAPGDKVHVRVTAGAPTLSWNVHTHDGGDTQILAEANAVDAIDYEIVGPPNDYWLLLVNSTGTLTVEVNLDLYGQAAYTSGL